MSILSILKSGQHRPYRRRGTCTACQCSCVKREGQIVDEASTKSRVVSRQQLKATPSDPCLIAGCRLHDLDLIFLFFCRYFLTFIHPGEPGTQVYNTMSKGFSYVIGTYMVSLDWNHTYAPQNIWRRMTPERKRYQNGSSSSMSTPQSHFIRSLMLTLMI